MANRSKAATRKVTKRKSKLAPDNDKVLTELRTFMRAKGEQLLKYPGVTSVGIGYSHIEGATEPQLSIHFTIDQAAAEAESLGSVESAVPESIEVAGMSIPTEKFARKYKPSYNPTDVALKDPRKLRADVIAPGFSIGNLITEAGTIGAFVRDRTTGETVLLSNWHVLQGPAASIGAAIVQPGRHDDNRVDMNRMGTLLRSHLGPAGDCAIARVDGRSIKPEVHGLEVPIAAIGDPEIGDAVVKSGRTTGVTRGKVVRIEVNTRMDYGSGVMATVGGFEIGIDPDHKPDDGEISRPGDSGSAWLAVDSKGQPTNVMLGLHFAGDAEGTTAEFALACYAKSVMTALEVEPAGIVASEALTLADGLIPRTGFDRNFLSFPIDVPTFTKSRRDDLAELDDSREIKYCHFSVWLSKKRRYPLCVAWNIDGDRFKRLNRTSFRTDRRGDLEEFQFTDDLYVHNPFDKGHIARRADLCWGTLDEARQGNYDSFYFTNIVPQHEAFNQSGNTDDDPEGGIWGRLENTVFDSEAPHRLRVSVMGGPVFGPKDRKFVQNEQECLVPDEFWKLVAYRDEVDNKEKVFAFLLTQKHLVAPLTVPEGLEFEPWIWARITLQDLAARTGIRFSATLRDHEVPFVAPQMVGAPALKLLASPGEYFS